MARIVAKPDWTVTRPSREKYPYDEWFDGKTRHLIRGEDFDVDVITFRATIYSASYRRDIRIRTKLIDDNTLQVQAY